MKTIHRFIKPQKESHSIVKAELRRGKKQTHWMWFTFPQIKGLGYSEIAKYYEIHSIYELRQFIHNKYLSDNLLELFNILLASKKCDAVGIFGDIDAIKLCSCLTLFSHTKYFHDITIKLLNKFFDGVKDDMTERIYKEMNHGSYRKRFSNKSRAICHTSTDTAKL